MDPLALRVLTRFQVRSAFQGALVGFGVKDLEHLSKKGRSFGVISAYRAGLSKSENQKRHGELVADLQRLGIRDVEMLKSSWDDMATGINHKEKSILIPNVSFEALHKLGEKYEQDAVLYKDPSGSVGVYFKNGTASMAFDPKGEAAISKSEKPGEYSKGRGLSFGLRLVEDRKFKYTDKPVTAEDIAKDLAKNPPKGAESEAEEKGADSDWWKAQSPEQKKTYCEAHPNSGYC